MKKNSELRALARSQLRGGWGPAIGVVLVSAIIIGASGIVAVGPIVLGGPFTLGLAIFFLKKARGESAKFEDLFGGFTYFGKSFVLYLVQMIFLCLWTCLFFIPGIIKSFSYAMAFYILRDNPEIGARAAITQSRKMMNGYKGKLFGLCLSFIGWWILCLISFGIGFIWLIPYMQTSMANFYEDLKQNQPAQGAAA